MARVIQIRNVPDRLHRRLEARAAQAGMSLSEFLLAEARKVAECPSRQELIDRVAQLPPVLRTRAAAAVRAERERR